MLQDLTAASWHIEPARAVHPSYLIHVASYNLGLIMRLLTGSGTPRGFQARISASLAAIATPDAGLAVILIVVAGDQTAAVAVSIEPGRFS